MAAKQVVAIIYATKGGLGDVGKYAVKHALQAGYTIKPIAMAPSTTEKPSFEFEVDVKPAELQDELRTVFANSVTPIEIVVDEDDAQTQLETHIRGADTVIACVGSRQPGYEIPALKARWCELGARKITAAMAAASIDRLVILSSFGIGDDYIPMGFVKVLWAVMLRTALKKSRKDLVQMEAHVTSTSLDYLIVRPTGLTPEAAPKGTWTVLSGKGSGNLKIEVSKSDVAKFMLEEAMKPSFSRTAVTVGGKA